MTQAVVWESTPDRAVPRLFTPPLVVGPPGPCGCGCALTEDTSYGFGADRFARETLLVPLDPWQRFGAIHAGELLPDGRPRFRRVIIVVARQNGKTHLLVVLTLYWLFVEYQRTILGTSTQTKYSKEPWQKSHDLALSVPELDSEVPRGRTRGMRKAAGQEEWWTVNGDRYIIAASNEEGGKSLTLNRVVADELARQFDYGAYSAAYYAMRAVADAQYFGLTTPLDARSVVFNDFRKACIDYIGGAEGDARLGLIEYSCPEDADPLDPDVLALANPNAGVRFGMDDLLNDARTAVRVGGQALVVFKTESMCISAKHADPAIDAARWAACPVAPAGFEDLRGKVALVLDVSMDGSHVSLYAAAVQPDGRARIGAVDAWSSTDAARRALPALVAKIKPRAFGWLPNGPAAMLAADLKDRKGQAPWPPPGVESEPITSEVPAVCMGFAEQVDSNRIARIPDPLLDDNVGTAERKRKPDGSWVFSREGEGPCDTLYAAAGAVHLARTLPPGMGMPRLVVAADLD